MMDSLKNIAFWYKGLSSTWRIILPVFGAILIAYLNFSEAITMKMQKNQEAKTNRASAKSLFEKALAQSQNVAALEDSFQEVNQRMAYFDRKAPSKVVIDKFLAEISKVAADSGVTITSFTPKLGKALEDPKKKKDKKKSKSGQAAAPPPKLAKVLTHTIDLQLKGRFAGVASFIDRLRRKDRIIHYPKINIKRDRGTLNKSKADDPSNTAVFTEADVTLHFYQGVL